MARPRKYKINESFFSEINTAEKAYILGFLYADGCISKDKLYISINSKDLSILNFIKKCLQSEHPIFLDKNKLSKIVISSKTLTTDLIKQNIIENKTYLSKSLPYKGVLFSHFLRGFFDGDGGISNFKNKGIVSFSSNIFVLNELKEFFKTNLNINSYLRQRTNNDFSWTLYITGSIQITKLYNFMYKNDVFSLLRKKEKFIYSIRANEKINKKHFKLNGFGLKIQELHNLSMTSWQIAKQLNLNPSSVSHYISKFKNTIKENE